MLVNIDEIKEGGLDRAWDLATERVDEMVKDDRAGYRSSGPLHVSARLKKVERRVFFEAHGRATLSAPCSRCLSQVRVDVPLDFEVTFVPGAEAPAADAEADAPAQGERRGGRGGGGRDHDGPRSLGSFAPEDADEEPYSGKVIDLDPVVREQLLLALPSYPVCDDACKGLCPSCGANLNERDCGCDRHVPDPRLAGLERFKDRLKEG